jgi:hypothetical protein
MKNDVKKVGLSFGRKEEFKILRDYHNLHVGIVHMLLVSHDLQELEVIMQYAEGGNPTMKELFNSLWKKTITDARTFSISLHRTCKPRVLC